MIHDVFRIAIPLKWNDQKSKKIYNFNEQKLFFLFAKVLAKSVEIENFIELEEWWILFRPTLIGVPMRPFPYFFFKSQMHLVIKSLLKLEGKYTEWPNPQKAENHACDRQSGLNDSAPWNHILVAWGKVA